MKEPPPPPPDDLAQIQRERAFKRARPISAGDLGGCARIPLFLLLLTVSVVALVVAWPLGVLMLFLLGLVALTAR